MNTDHHNVTATIVEILTERLQLDVDDLGITDSTALAGLDIDSLVLIELAVCLEEIYAIAIDEDRLKPDLTVGEIAGLVLSELGVGQTEAQ